MWFTHVIFGLFISVISLRFFSTSWPEAYIFLVCIGSLLPDIDSPNSIINRKLKITRWASHMLTHRGFFHSIFPVIMIYVLLASVGWTTSAIALSLGYMSHIAIDALTVKGINIIHPIKSLRISGFIETGSIGEWIIFGLIVGSTIIVLSEFPLDSALDSLFS